MIKLHATRKLFAKLPLNSDGQLPVTRQSEWLYEQPALDNNLLSDWHGKLVTLQHRNCMLLIHDATRFPLVFFALTKPDFAELNGCFMKVFINTLIKCEASEAQLEAAQRHLRPLTVDTECNRSAQATLNRMKEELALLLEYDDLKVTDIIDYNVSAWLAETPRSIKGSPFLWPQREMLSLLDGLATTADTRPTNTE